MDRKTRRRLLVCLDLAEVPSPSILILFGGSSDERRVSVASAQNIATHFPEALLWFVHPDEKVSHVDKTELLTHARPFETDFHPKDAPFAKTLADAASDPKGARCVWFLGLHGGNGENGTLQELLEQNTILFTGSDAVSSRNAFDKRIAKWLVKQANIRTAPEWEVNGSQGKQVGIEILSTFQAHGDLIAKPVTGGSSIGLYRLQSRAEIDRFVGDLIKMGNVRYLIEPLIRGREITVGVISRKGSLQALPPSEAITQANQNFDYEGKYLGKGAVEVTPAEISREETLACQQMAIASHEALGCAGYTRTDMILTKTGPVFLETNTLPGLTKASFIPQQLHAANIPIKDFFAEQIQFAQNRYGAEKLARRS